MPRVRPSDHFHRYQFLRVAWLEFPKLYAALPLHSQHQLHEFYQPSIELTKAQLLTHIKAISETRSALVHQAGKHYKLLHHIFRYLSETLNIPRSEWYKALSSPIQHHNPSPAHIEVKDSRRYTISAVARPEIDIQLLTKALLGLVEQEEDKK